jgi:hypothetical protein
MATVGGFDWSKFNQSLKKQRARKPKKTGGGKGDAWRRYVGQQRRK